MFKRHLLLIGVFAGLLFVSCGTRTHLFQTDSTLERNWGRSFEAAMYNQILNPDADKNLDPVLGLDGQASDYNVNKYKEGFKEKETKEVVNILKLQ